MNPGGEWGGVHSTGVGVLFKGFNFVMGECLSVPQQKCE